MSDEIGTDKTGRRRRAIRRLTHREIPLPASASTPPVTYSVGPIGESIAPAAASSGPSSTDENSPPSVAGSLAELRLPPAGAESSASEASSPREPRPTRDTQVDVVGRSLPPLAADELPDDEPATNPKIKSGAPVAFAKARAEEVASADDEIEVDTSDGEEIDATEPEPATGQLKKPSANRVADASQTDGVGAGASDAGESSDGGDSGQRRGDSDVPTRPRIELSSEMALAAGRVTSLDISPLEPRDGQIKRGSKMPPSGEPRMISSLTGRRSSIPVSSDEDDEASRPAVIVTRAKVISDRPPRPESERSSSPDRLSSTKSAPEPAPATPQVAAVRQSRRPGTLDGEEFETLDIEDGETELQLPRGLGPSIESEAVPSKAPPPPPVKRAAAVPPPQSGPVQPKAAPPPPPRAPTGQISIPTTAAAATAVAAPAPVAAAAAAPASAASGGGSGAGSGGGGGQPAKKSGTRQQPRRRQWWETLFSDDYLRTVVRPTVAQIARQVDFMQASLGVSKGTAVLDVGCGLGQHALEFARRGCLVVALDLALPMITRAAEEAQQENLRINFLHKDIRDIGFEGTFDAVVCVGTTFGFFDDEQNREVLGRLATALKPGGRLLLEVVNRDHVLPLQPNLQWFEGDGCVVMEETDFNYYSSRLSVKRTMMREDGRQTESEYSIRLYSLHELGQMMQQVGFRVKEVSGQHATRGVFFGAQSNRIILLAERKGGPARSNGHSDPPGPADS